MACRKFYFHIVFRVIIILLNCLLLCWFIFQLPNVSLIILAAAGIAYQVIALIGYLNRVNTKIENTFLALLSGEVTSVSSNPGRKEEFYKISDYFNRLNQKLEGVKLEHEIRNNYFKTIVDQTSVGLISFEDDGHVEFVNEATRRIFKMFVLKNLTRLDTYKEGLSTFLLGLEPEKTELVTVVINGVLTQLSVKKINFKAGTKSLHLVTLQDIREELDQKEIESWQKLIRVLTHEIMNSITPITSVVNTLGRMFKSRESGKIVGPEDITVQSIERTVMGLDIVEQRGAGLIQFVNNYRQLTKLPIPEFQVAMVKPILQHVQMFYQALAEQKQVSLEIECHPSLEIRIDSALFEQVLMNLVKNAIEACEGKTGGHVKLVAGSTSDFILIEVEDNGKGIVPEVAENMFVPFFTTKEKGSGIGLNLSRQIIRLMGGNLDFTSIPGEKTVFTIKI